jgi:hypothetical protein
MDLQSRGFDIDPEITAKLLRLGYRIHEVPISYIARTREEGKKVKPIDGVRALLTLARYRTWRPMRKVAESELPGRVARSEETSADSPTIRINDASGPPWYREPR